MNGDNRVFYNKPGAEEKVEISGVTSIREGNKKNFSAFLDKTTLNNNDQSHLNEPTGTPLNV